MLVSQMDEADALVLAMFGLKERKMCDEELLKVVPTQTALTIGSFWPTIPKDILNPRASSSYSSAKEHHLIYLQRIGAKMERIMK